MRPVTLNYAALMISALFMAPAILLAHRYFNEGELVLFACMGLVWLLGAGVYVINAYAIARTNSGG